MTRQQTEPLWTDVGRIDTFDHDGRWTVVVWMGMTDDAESVDLPETYDTEGKAVDAAKAWAGQRGLITTWTSMTLRRKRADHD